MGEGAVKSSEGQPVWERDVGQTDGEHRSRRVRASDEFGTDGTRHTRQQAQDGGWHGGRGRRKMRMMSITASRAELKGFDAYLYCTMPIQHVR